MDRGWRLGAFWYGSGGELTAPASGKGCTWALVRRDGDGPRMLLQLWEPRPSGKVLDHLREEFLQRFSQAEPLDPGGCHLGFDDDKAWFLQELSGTPLLKLWGETGPAGRKDLLVWLLKTLAGSKVARFLAPEVIGLKPGRLLVPRMLGEAPWSAQELGEILNGIEPGPEGDGSRPWAAAPDLAEAARGPLRGRSLELTYLKSLMFGLSAVMPMERILILQGEAGLGHDRLCDWAAAAAETEGIWVSKLEALPEEKAGGFLERVVQDLIAGQEADFYGEAPDLARALSRRLPAFAFLRGGRPADHATRKVEPEEVQGALGALAFAQGQHPRLLQIRSLERALPEVQELVKELALASTVPWILSCRTGALAPGAKSFLAVLGNSAAAASVVLDRIEDRHLGGLLADLLGPHVLPEPFAAEICAACLGNPGLMQSILEMAQVKGLLVRKGGKWICAPGRTPHVEVQGDLVEGILAGRLQRLNPPALALVRFLALADHPLSLATLARALGLDGDATEEALHTAVSAKLVLAADSGERISTPQVRELALAKMAPTEISRCARVLLKILEEEGGKPVLSVRLQSFASDRKAALTQVLHAIRRELPGPQAAERIVQEALELQPDARQRARLWEFLSDNWCVATEADHPATAGPAEKSPTEAALEALLEAIAAMAEPVLGGTGEDYLARLQRKKGMLEIRLHRLGAARESFLEAENGLRDRPLHPEQPRLRLAWGKLHLLQGQSAQGISTLEEGLMLLGEKGTLDGKQDQAALLLELGRAQGQRALFQSALGTLESAKRLLEHLGDRRRLVAVLDSLSQAHLGLGQMDLAGACLKEAMLLARLLEDVELQATCHLQLGIQNSIQQFLGPALSHLDSAYRRFDSLGDRTLAAQTQAWKARTMAALGDTAQAELILLQCSSLPLDGFTAMELGDRGFLDGEMAGFREAWGEARRHFQGAANRFEGAGLSWRERLCRLRCIQAEAMEATGSGPSLKSAWIRLESLKGPVDASGSRWLEIEWHRAHALLLGLSGNEEAIVSQALMAWGEVLAGGRELRFPTLVVEASARSSALLLDRGERLGARSRVQEAYASFQSLWQKLPEPYETAFLGRRDIHGFRLAVEAAGLPFVLPERTDPLADWNPTQANLPSVPSPRANP